ncbi:MAG: metallophosphoesterase [Candidatus Thorarchaeota archaeon]|nr:metallophosphoesterase [Candidatus Thorarchaeota archaeon]
MRIAAVADVHSPRFLQEFTMSLQECQRPDIFLLAGDIIERGSAEQFAVVLDTIDDVLGKGFPIVSCFGNEEYTEVRKNIISLVSGRVVILDEKAEIFTIDGVRVGIVGTQGSLDRPTTWQERHMPSIRSTFERRAHRAESLLRKIRSDVDRRILLMHYSPCLETCEGENTRSFPWLGSRKFYRVLIKERPDLVIHGHVHNAVVHEAEIGGTLVRNVALPAVGRVTELDIW